MPKRATLKIGGPATTLYLRGECPPELQPLSVVVSIDGVPLSPATIRKGENAFEISFPLPAKPQYNLTIEAARTFRPAADPRDLALAFGTIEVR